MALGEGAEGKREIGYRADGEEAPFVVCVGVRREEIGEYPEGGRVVSTCGRVMRRH